MVRKIAGHTQLLRYQPWKPHQQYERESPQKSWFRVLIGGRPLEANQPHVYDRYKSGSTGNLPWHESRTNSLHFVGNCWTVQETLLAMTDFPFNYKNWDSVKTEGEPDSFLVFRMASDCFSVIRQFLKRNSLFCLSYPFCVNGWVFVSHLFLFSRIKL
jgi:hypothetical protein